MPYAPNVNWTAKAALEEQAPSYFVVISGLSYRFSTHAVKGASVTYKAFMKIPDGAGTDVEPLKGQSSIGSVSFTLVDNDGSVVDMLATEKASPTLDTLINRRVTLYGGYQELDEADYAKLFDGEVEEWKMERGGAAFTFRLRDLKRVTLDDIMLNSSEATPTIIEGNPIDIWYAIMTGDFASVDFPVTVSGATPTGLGMSAALIDDAHLESERDNWLFGWNMRFEFRDREKAKSFFEEELFRIKGYPIIRPDGRLSVRLYHPAHPAEALVEITEDDIIGTPSISPSFKLHLNDITIKGDHDPDAADANLEFPATLYSFADASDKTATRETGRLEIESRGLRTDLDGARNAAFAGGKLKQRYLKPPVELSVTTFFTKRVLEVGEVVFVTHSHLPNLQTGARGWTQVPCEVIKADPDFRKGRINFRLLSTNFGRRYRVIAPTGLVDYTAQSDAQKARYGSIADSPTELFSNGDLAHQII